MEQATATFDVTTMQSLLSAEARQLFPAIEHLSEVTSTNDYLLHLSQQDVSNTICFTETQTHGRGRRGQQWISNSDDICFSILWNTTIQLEQLAGVSLVVALALVKALQTTYPDLEFFVKWPNDIYQSENKISGILIESTKNKAATAVIIGIGLNLKNDKEKQKLKNAYTCLNDITDSEPDCNELIATIINRIQQDLHQFEEEGLSSFIEQWRKYDISVDKNITVSTNQKEIHGLNRGINENGELVLALNDHEKICIHSGKISPPTLA